MGENGRGLFQIPANILIEILQPKNGDDSQNIVTYAELGKYALQLFGFFCRNRNG